MDNLSIVNFKNYPLGIEKAINYYHSKWGSAENHAFFYDIIFHSSNNKMGLPRFFLLTRAEEIIGCIGLSPFDFISRADLTPWLVGLFIEKEYRGKNLGNHLMTHVEKEAKNMGYKNLYLTTDHIAYYEKYGWIRIEDGIDLFSGRQSRIYIKHLE